MSQGPMARSCPDRGIESLVRAVSLLGRALLPVHVTELAAPMGRPGRAPSAAEDTTTGRQPSRPSTASSNAAALSKVIDASPGDHVMSHIVQQPRKRTTMYGMLSEQPIDLDEDDLAQTRREMDRLLLDDDDTMFEQRAEQATSSEVSR